MIIGTRRILLPLLGMVIWMLLGLLGCGGSSGDGQKSATVTRTGRLALQLTLPDREAGAPLSGANPAAQTRQVQPGDAGFVERLEVAAQAQGRVLLPTQTFRLSAAEQETVMREITVPVDPGLQSFQILVAAFNAANVEIFRGATTVTLGQTSAVITLARSTLIPTPATPGALQGATFRFADGAAFGLPGVGMTLALGTFTGNSGTFTLVSSGFLAGGTVTIRSCDFVVVESTFPAGRGPQDGDRLLMNPCDIDTVDGRLLVVNALTGVRSASDPPVDVDNTLPPLNPAPAIVTNEDTPGTTQITVSTPANRTPAVVAIAIMTPPEHGMATVNATGLLTYTPMADFNGSDSLVLSVAVTFTDGLLPDALLGTVPVPITVRPVNDPPEVTRPGDQTARTGDPVVVNIMASDRDGDTLRFSAMGLPPGLSINATTGLISGTIAAGAAADSPYNVTVSVSDGTATTSVTFITTVIQANRAPVPTAPNITTPAGMAGTSQVAPNDPDAGQSHTFSISTPPAQGSASVNASGLATYTPPPDFVGTTSFGVTVTDNGTPPLTGAVTIAATVNALPPAPAANRAPAPTALAITTMQDTPGSSQVSPNDPDVGQSHAFSISTPPAQGSASVSASGLATYTPPPAFVGTTNFGVTVTDTGTPPLTGTVLITVTVNAPPNRAPAPTAPAITTNMDVAGTSQIVPNDPDTGQSHTFSITTPPANGTAMVSAAGLVTYTPNHGFIGGDSLRVSVTDNGMPSLSVSVTITITVVLAPNTVRIGSQAATPGAIFTLPVQLNAGAPGVVSYLFELMFDHTVVQVTAVQQGSPPFEVPTTNPAAFNTGAVKFTANTLMLAPASGLITLANITFQVVGPSGSSSSLGLRFPVNAAGKDTGVLVNSMFQAIPSSDVVFVPGTVDVK